MGDVKRGYDSPKRRRQAEETRRKVAASARRLFAGNGYEATTIEAIAADAGVAVQTFYATYGSKRAVLLALLEQVEREADLPDLVVQLNATSDARAQLRYIVDFNVRLFQRAGDVIAVLAAAGRRDADLNVVWREGEERRRAGQSPLVQAWARAGVLRAGLAEEAAGDILWALTGPDTYRLFVVERGWSESSFADWLWLSLQQLLFA